MQWLNLLAVDINNVGLNKTYNMQKELSKKIDKIWRYKQKTEKICLDPEFDPDG